MLIFPDMFCFLCCVTFGHCNGIITMCTSFVTCRSESGQLSSMMSVVYQQLGLTSLNTVFRHTVYVIDTNSPSEE